MYGLYRQATIAAATQRRASAPWEERLNTNLRFTTFAFDLSATENTVIDPAGEAVTIYDIVDLDNGQTRWVSSDQTTPLVQDNKYDLFVYVWVDTAMEVAIQGNNYAESAALRSLVPGWNLIDFLNATATSTRANGDARLFQWTAPSPSYGAQIAFGPYWVLPA